MELLAQISPAQLERTYTLIEKGPQTFVAAFFALTTATLLTMLLKEVRGRVHQERAHKEEVKTLLNAERERAVKQETVNHGLLEFVRLGAITVRAGNPKRLRLPGGRVLVGYFIDDDPLAPEAPTVSSLKAGGSSDG